LSAAAIDPLHFRQVIGHFATGVTVVTSGLGEQRHAMTANAVSSVSLEPLLVLVCIDTKARTLELVKRTGNFALNILAEDQEWIGRHCAARATAETDRLAIVPHHGGVTGAPIIDHSLAYVDCRLWAQYDGGDHAIVVGEVADVGLSGGRPLLFFGGRFTSLIAAGLALLREDQQTNPLVGDVWL
jgi:flavin reductase (DIM6/NTAB) family NADH-FMN oxidoreductase RutF